MPVTLILTRNPLKSFQYGRKSGRWGELIAVKGPKVTAVRLTAAAGTGSSLPAGMGQLAAQAVAQVAQSIASSQSQNGGLPPAMGQLAAQAVAQVAQSVAASQSQNGGLPPAMRHLAAQAIAQVVESIASSQSQSGGLPPAMRHLAAQAVAQVIESVAASQSPNGGLTPAMRHLAAQAVAQVAQSVAASQSQNGAQTIPVTNGVLQISTTGSPILDKKRFTSMERFKSDNGQGYYVQLRPKPEPYQITYEPGNSAVKEMRPDHDGRCFRVHGGKGRERGILIHEAPHVGWVIGCISPRPLNDFTIVHPNRPGNPSYQCMNELFQFVGRQRADLFVLDW